MNEFESLHGWPVSRFGDKMKMKVLKNIFWAVICIIGVGWRIRMDY